MSQVWSLKYESECRNAQRDAEEQCRALKAPKSLSDCRLIGVV